MIIGITGKSGSGKSTYAEKLAKNTNYFVLHIDEIGHKVLEYDNIKNKLEHASYSISTNLVHSRIPTGSSLSSTSAYGGR